ncbi:DUF4276 family protein [Stigmatella aurantiaca]|uniref:Conserved uncharacterized protein n=1 Tax=Stigmatella aurantiaca (strain DW4/3-1) TaxID=378806 RepID=Q08WA3_STIAD|nr:DUF4276 family protein [Stigmatella aurantiaca]ADO68523.1 conserved uncharacterized protein [Stigmatella aurantiaca DW4/3-1]EAU64759.1 conserved hypothetical protein [Stigmatella aurantiaca DW4/3-1]
MSVRIYVEGGGTTGALKSECRRGFAEFFKKFLPVGKQPKVIACGSRNEALDDFRTALRKSRGDYIVLLVDAEAPVGSAQEVWSHLEQRDGWTPPDGATEDNTHLMVQCMESWFLADVPALSAYFGKGFQASALPKNPHIEAVSKQDVLKGLENATRQAQTKGIYSKGGHSFAILALIDPVKVRHVSPHAERLAATLLRLAA